MIDVLMLLLVQLVLCLIGHCNVGTHDSFSIVVIGGLVCGAFFPVTFLLFFRLLRIRLLIVLKLRTASLPHF